MAELDQAKYPLGIRMKKHRLQELNLEPHAIHGEWNYTLRPRSQAQLDAIAAGVARAHAPTSYATTRARWLQLIREHEQSGLSEREFCRKRGINRSSFKTARISSAKLIKRQALGIE